MARDSITRTGARTRGVERHRSLAWRCSTEQVVSGSERRLHAATESTKDGGKLDLATGMLGASLTAARSGKALSDRPALEPYRGKTRRTESQGGRWKRRHHSKSATRHRPTRQVKVLVAAGKAANL